VAERGKPEKEIRPQILEGDDFSFFLSLVGRGRRKSDSDVESRRACVGVCRSFSGGNEF
jgi:hypothetical protein